MRHENESVVLQAIEFWSTICEVELDRMMEADVDEAAPSSLGFAASAMPEITPVILWVMTKQDEDDDEDEWTPSKAAGTCLQLFAAVTGSAIIERVLPFIRDNIQNPDWRFRETACMAFGSIIDGPSPADLAPLISSVA
jgi:importin subunit beta-1